MTAQEPLSEDLGGAFRAIDAMVDRVERFKAEPQFTEEVNKRKNRAPDFTLTDERLLERLIALIAFSNNASAKSVEDLVQRGVFSPIFQNYSVERAAALSADDILCAHWHEIGAIRFKRKVDAMVCCAKCLLKIRDRHGSLMGYLRSVGLPSAVKSRLDIQAFWEGFSRAKAHFREVDFPYFRNFTSLCHLLMDQGFDCAKPDLAVMSAAVDLGIVPPPPRQKKNPQRTSAHPEQSLRKTAETIQEYAVAHVIRVPVMDLYFLVKGGQSGARKYVQDSYYL